MLISVVIPTLNEVSNLERLVPYLRQLLDGIAYEIIVSDGGSNDGSAAISRYAGVRFIRAERGQAVQLNAGAKVAKGAFLYFLHADCLPPRNLLNWIKKAQQQDVDSACFRLRFDDRHPLLSVLGWGSRFDFSAFRYGDQSLLVHRKSFEAIRGYDESCLLMEGNEIIRRLKKQGDFRLFPDDVITSARKYRKHGPFYLQGVYTLIYTLGWLGVGQHKLLRLYASLVSKKS